MRISRLIPFLLLLASVACARVDVRPAGVGTDRPEPLFPDYRDVTVPVNIAPLNFYYTDPDGKRFETRFSAGSASRTFRGREVVWAPRAWKKLLAAAEGSDIRVESAYEGSSGPVRFAWSLHVSADPVDPYLTYRLIEPGFEVWDDLEIVERDLTSFATRPISDWRNTENKCMNCHIHAQGRGDLSLFYLRGQGGGAILNRDGALRKLNLRDSAMISSTVYGEIHPAGRFGVFSTNVIVPGMHPVGNRRMEVFDTASDLCVADFDANRMSTFAETARPDVFETFPAFSADGRSVIYCSAPARQLPAQVEEMKYSLVRIPFDPETGALGAPADTLWSGPAHGASACHPKASPDGRWLLFTVADYGTFPINHGEFRPGPDGLPDRRAGPDGDRQRGQVRHLPQLELQLPLVRLRLQAGRRHVRQALVLPRLRRRQAVETLPAPAAGPAFLRQDAAFLQRPRPGLRTGRLRRPADRTRLAGNTGGAF